MEIHGIVFGAQPYGQDDATVISIEGAEIDAMVGSCVFAGVFETPLALVTECRKVLGAQDCRSDADRGLLDMNQGQPFVRVTARVLDTDRGRELDVAVREKLMVWYAMGYILERHAGNVIARARLKGVLASFHNARSPYRVFPGSG